MNFTFKQFKKEGSNQELQLVFVDSVDFLNNLLNNLFKNLCKKNFKSRIQCQCIRFSSMEKFFSLVDSFKKFK